MDRIALTTEERQKIAEFADWQTSDGRTVGPERDLLMNILIKMRPMDMYGKLLAAGFTVGLSHRGAPAMLLADPAGNGTATFTDRTGMKLPCDGDWALEIRAWPADSDEAETDIQCDDAADLDKPMDALVDLDETISLAVRRIADIVKGI